MPTLGEQIAQAKAAGYSDDEIAQHLSAKPELAPKIKQATEAGYKADQIIAHLSDGAVKTTPAQATTSAPSSSAPYESSLGDRISQGALNFGTGALRGAGSIGATLMYPVDKITDIVKGDRGPNIEGLITGKQPLSRNEERRASMTDVLRDEIGAETDSLGFKGGKLAGEIAGTAGAGGAAANVVGRAAPLLVRAGVSAPTIANATNALATSGFRAGTATGAQNMLLRAAGGAVTGGLSAGMVDPENAGTGALIGGALPIGTKLAGAAGSALRNSALGQGVSNEVKALAQRAKDLGIMIPADRLADSKPLNALASALNYVPFSGRAATEKAMDSSLNQALSRTFGQNSENVTGALRKASGELGQKFDDVLRNNAVQVDNTLINELGSIEATADRELGQDGMRAIRGQINELLDKGATGQIDGQAAYNIKRTLDRIGNRNTPEAFHALEMKRALMDALNRSIGPAEAAAFAETRKQYGNMLALEKIAKNGAEGDISVARLANMKNINNKDLQELADIAAQFVKPRESQHGAMQRAVLGLTAGATGGVPGIAATAATGRGANMALNSNMLRNAVLNGSSPQSAQANQMLQSLYQAAPVIGTNH